MVKEDEEYAPLLDGNEAGRATEAADEPVEDGPVEKEVCGYPAQVYFILGNEFCERFSYYGMHAILVIYLTSMLDMSKDQATAWYHAFNMMCYFSPLLGAMIADSYWGKYKTILYLSVVYGIGNIVVSVTAIPDILDYLKMPGPAVGLLLISIGTGGIKPCVSSFGGDQFKDGQEHLLKRFFSMFYFAINVGSLISTMLTPILRGDVSCFGYDCYPLAFGVPAMLMILSVVLFLCGSRLYRKIPPEGNVVLKVSRAMSTAWKNRLRNRGSGVSKEHWMDWAEGDHNAELISDIKALCKVLFMFLPLPVFWTLFDQQGSRWTLQAMDMNGDIGVFGTLKPDQMQALNPVFVMVLIPFAQYIVYPLLGKCKLLTKPLQRMAFGQLLVALSFVWAGMLQMRMDSTMSSPLAPAMPGHANVRFINAIPRTITIEAPEIRGNVTIQQQQATEYFSVPVHKFTRISAITAWGTGADSPWSIASAPAVDLQENRTYSILVASNRSEIDILELMDETVAQETGHAEVRFIHAAACTVQDNVVVKLNKSLVSELSPLQSSPAYIDLNSGSYLIRVRDANGEKRKLGSSRQRFDNGGIYTVLVQPDANSSCSGVHLVTYADVAPSSVSILWQAPQYLTITMGEVMFSITGLEFAYSQSPPSMKSCIMAAWLLTVSVGNLIVVILAGLKLTEDMALEFFCFAGFLAVVTAIFALMSYFYKYVNYGSQRRATVGNLADAADDDDQASPSSSGKQPLLPPDTGGDEFHMQELNPKPKPTAASPVGEDGVDGEKTS